MTEIRAAGPTADHEDVWAPRVRSSLPKGWEVAFGPVVVFVLARFGLTGGAPAWILCALHCPLIAIGIALSIPAVRRRMEQHPPPPEMQLFTVAFCTAATYVMGWGPLLVTAYLAVIVRAIDANGPRAWRPTIVASVIGVTLGQLAVQVGWAPSYVRAPEAHALAALGLVVTVIASKALARAAEERDRAHRQLGALVHNGSDVITVVDADQRILYMSDSVEEVLGYHASDMTGRTLGDLCVREDVATAQSAIASGHATVELRIRHADGSDRWCEARVTNRRDDPDVRGFVLNIRDVTVRRQLEEELRYKALHDSLSGLANRALFVDRLDHAMARQRRTGEDIAVLLVDLDDFKAINDSFGHHTGDQLLTEVAARLLRCTRASDTVARLGGDEFALLLEHWTDAEEPRRIANRILDAFAEGVEVAGTHLPLSGSVGIAVAAPWVDNAADLLQNADVAMYEAKARGKGQAVQFEPTMRMAVHSRLGMRGELHDAVTSGDQLVLHYQPVIDIHNGETVGAEALIRWHHPVHGLISPADFIPIAEDSGLIVPIGRWVLSEACSQAAAWQTSSPSGQPISLSVNVSGRQLDDPGFVDDVRRALATSGLDPRCLILEITESVIMREADIAAEMLLGLKELGIRIAIDDFGTGYSSLAYLRRFPVDILKVDRSFITGLEGDADQAAMAEVMVTIGRLLHLEIVAEGIETEEQAAHLRRLDCQYGQGFLYSRPLPSRAIEDWLNPTPTQIQAEVA